MDLTRRSAAVIEIAQEAGALALDYAGRLSELDIEAKGHQDFVTEADRSVELLVRAQLGAAFPDDAIVGEEHDDKPGTSGFTWVIDPIDGTANFVAGLPFWCVAIACVAADAIQIGVIHDPNHAETFAATRGQGATLNDQPMAVRAQATISDGTVSIGSSRRSPPDRVAHLVHRLVTSGGVFQRLGSGALGLAYVAAGRYLGYVESYMNAWDCLAGQLLVHEAGGRIEEQSADAMIAQGGRVIAAAPGVFDALEALTTDAFGKTAPPKPPTT